MVIDNPHCIAVLHDDLGSVWCPHPEWASASQTLLSSRTILPDLLLVVTCCHYVGDDMLPILNGDMLPKYEWCTWVLASADLSCLSIECWRAVAQAAGS